MANSLDPDQTVPIGAVCYSVDPDQTAPICSGSTLFASITYSSVILGNDLQQTTSADDIFTCIIYWRFKG